MMNEREYWVIFKEGDLLISKLLKKQFGHVVIMMRDHLNWVLVDPKVDRMHWQILPYEASNVYAPRQEFREATILHVKTASQTKKWFMRLFLGNCTNFLQYMMGIKVGGWTPYGFYKKLLWASNANKGIEVRRM